MFFHLRTRRSRQASHGTTMPGLSTFRLMAKLTWLLLFLCSIKVSAATHSITQDTIRVSGTVTDSTGSPVPGVTVKVQGTTQGTTTDANGNYQFARVPQGATLLFSMMGYVPQQMKATGSHLNIHLKTGSRLLDEVVITDGYRTTTRAANTSAIGTIGGAALENKPFSTFMQSMQGKIAGVSAPLTSGQPGGNVNIRIRGVGSLSLSSDPLIVVDGMIVNSGALSGTVTTSNALAGINQNDIESIDVLKDAAATALYGSRGSTGVIVITTKRGKMGKTAVRADAEVGQSSPINLPDAGKPLTADQYAELFKEALTNANYTPAQIKDLSDKYGINSGKSNNWYDLVTRNGRQQQYNVSINGGTEKSKLFASAGYFDQQATTIGADFKRISGLFNYDHQINKRIQLSTGINVSNVGQNTPYSTQYSGNPTYAARVLTPFQLAYKDDGSINTSTSGNTNFPAVYNPLWIAQHDKKYLSETRMLGSTRLKWNIWDQLTYTSYFSIDYNTLEETVFLNPTMGDGVNAGGTGGTSKNYYSRYFNWLTRNQLDYRYDISAHDNFYVLASVGYEAQKSKKYMLAAVGSGFPSAHEDLTALGNAATPTTAFGQYNNYAFTSLYSNASVNYKNKYALSGSFRRDGSSRFPADHRNANFYSVGGTWNVQEENFFHLQHILSSLKIRSSYGTTGNANLGNYDWIPQAAYGATYGYAGYNGNQYTIIGSKDLRWETSKKFDAGTDIGFANDRFILTVDYYNNNIDGLIRSVATSLTTGFGAVSQNVGSMVNKGWEFTLKGDIVKARQFNWYSNFNIALNKNAITKLPKGTNERNDQFYLKEGYSFNNYYMKEFAGVDPQTGSPLYYTDGGHATTTTDISKAAYVVLNKQSIPKYVGGFNNVFTYKGISLGVDFTYNLGYYVYGASDIYFTSGLYYNYNKYQFIYNRRWTTQGQQTDVPKYSPTTDNSVSTYRLYRGDHIRLQNLSVGYDFKNVGFVNRLGVNKLHVYARATNLWLKTFDDRLPFDPEVSYSGFDYQNMLKYKTFTVGINVGL